MIDKNTIIVESIGLTIGELLHAIAVSLLAMPVIYVLAVVFLSLE